MGWCVKGCIGTKPCTSVVRERGEQGLLLECCTIKYRASMEFKLNEIGLMRMGMR